MLFLVYNNIISNIILIFFFCFFVYSCYGKLSLISVSGYIVIVFGGNNFFIKVNIIYI